MKRELIVTPTTGMSREDWLRFRKKGIGASDVGTILGLNQYKANIELFYERIGWDLDYTVENIASFMGREMEDFIAELWTYWGGTQESMIANYRDNNPQRKCQRVNAYVQNPKYPWLFVSLDRKINKGERGEEGALEIKTIAGYEADKWEAEIPPGHIVQVQTQLAVCEFNFGEIAALRDGRQFDVFPFDSNVNIQEAIIERTHDFWMRVEKARSIMTGKFEAERTYNMAMVQELQGRLEELEPDPDGSEAYSKFLKKRFAIAETGIIKGSDAMYEVACAHLTLKDQKKELEESIREKENILKREIGDARVLEFGKLGRINFHGEPRRFMNKVKKE